MTHLDIAQFDDFNDQEIARRLLLEDPVLRVVLVSLRAGQSLPEYAANVPVTIYAISGRVRLRESADTCEMTASTLLHLSPGRAHSLEAVEDARLLVTVVKPADAAAWNSLAPAGRDVDLRSTPRERRHGIVFWAFDNLRVGESFFLVNDHDPVPLRMQIEQQRPGQMNWEYAVQGPYEYRIRVSRVAPAA